MNNNVKLCSYWLFHSVAHLPHSRKETQGGKNIYFNTFSQLYRRVIINAGIRELLLICWALKLLLNARSLLTFEIRDRTYSVYTIERQYLPYILQDQMLFSGAEDL